MAPARSRADRDRPAQGAVACSSSAYDDAAGVTARFNLNLLDPDQPGARAATSTSTRFRHEANWRDDEGRVELGLRSLADQTVRIEALDTTVAFAAGEWLHTEDSYKYSLAEIDALCAAAGLEATRRWTDAAGRYTLNWLRPGRGRRSALSPSGVARRERRRFVLALREKP